MNVDEIEWMVLDHRDTQHADHVARRDGEPAIGDSFAVATTIDERIADCRFAWPRWAAILMTVERRCDVHAFDDLPGDACTVPSPHRRNP